MQKSSFKSLHSHVRSLGVDKFNMPISTSFHLIGQRKAREALGIITKMVKMGKFSGRLLVLNGPPSCGKTSAGIAMSKELGDRTPFTFITGGEIQCGTNPHQLIQSLPGEERQVYNQSGLSQAEIIDQAVRRSIMIRIREIKNIYEGEVIGIVDGEALTLRSRKGTLTLRDVSTKDISLGDIVYVEGKIIKKLGKCESKYKKNDLDSYKYMPLPKGEVYKKKEKISYLTLHDLDHFYSDRVRKEVDSIVNNYLEKGLAEVYLGVLFIDEAQVLDSFSLSYLGKVSEGMSPLIILSSNNKLSDPEILLNKAVVVKMERLSAEEIKAIALMRMREEEYEVDADELTRVCMENGLRYGLSILRVMKVLGSKSVHEATDLFSSFQ